MHSKFQNKKEKKNHKATAIEYAHRLMWIMYWATLRTLCVCPLSSKHVAMHVWFLVGLHDYEWVCVVY